jgi:beta-phosphoglucomutase-like phosphatase (HAD superfamily)
MADTKRNMVLLDIDGVLMHSELVVMESYLEAFQSLGLPFSETVYHDLVWGRSWAEATENLRNLYNGFNGEACHARKNTIFARKCQEEPHKLKIDPLACRLAEAAERFMRVRLITAGSESATGHKMRVLRRAREDREFWHGVHVQTSVQKLDPDTWRVMYHQLSADRFFVVDDQPQILSAALAGADGKDVICIPWKDWRR